MQALHIVNKIRIVFALFTAKAAFNKKIKLSVFTNIHYEIFFTDVYYNVVSKIIYMMVEYLQRFNSKQSSFICIRSTFLQQPIG